MGLFLYLPPNLRVSASDCRYASRLLRPMAADCGSIKVRMVHRSTLRYPSPYSQIMADLIEVALIDDDEAVIDAGNMIEKIHSALIDDDPAVLDSLQLYLQRNGVKVSCFPTAEDFLATEHAARSFDCVVTDVRMPGLSGIDLVRQVIAARALIPIILITAHGDVEMAVTAIKLGAFDFIEKPFDEQRLLDSIQRAVCHARDAKEESADLQQMLARADSLTDRQREVMELAAAGLSNKEIAQQLHISRRTVGDVIARG